MTKSLEDYLEMILVLIREHRVARVRDVAAAIDVKMPSVVKALGELKKRGLVRQEPYGDIELTPKGGRLASSILNRHHILKAFLLKLGVGEECSDRDACHMEHIVSDETLARIRDFLGDMDPSKGRAKAKPTSADGAGAVKSPEKTTKGKATK